MQVTGNDRDLVRMVQCEVGIDEHFQAGDELGERQSVFQQCPSSRIRVKDDIQ